MVLDVLCRCWWRAPTTSMVWCIGFKMSWYVCTSLQHGSRRRACGSVHCVDVLVAQVAGWFWAECVNSIVGCRTESVVGWSSQPRSSTECAGKRLGLRFCHPRELPELAPTSRVVVHGDVRQMHTLSLRVLFGKWPIPFQCGALSHQ